MLEDIEVFCTIAKQGGFAKAARVLHISTSMVTRRLSNLEESLGVRLLQRTTRQVSLTEAGQQYYDEMSQILERLQISNKNVKTLSKEVTGTLKVGLPVSISSLYVTQHLQEFLDQHPHIKVTICHGNHLFDLLDNQFDFVVHCGELPSSNFYYKKIGSWKKIIAASPSYLAKYGTPKTPDDLAEHNCLDHGENFDFTWRFQQREKLRDLSVSGNVRVNSSLDLANLASNGIGIVYLPCFVIAEQLKTGRLKSILDEYRPPELGLYCVYPSSKYLNQKTRLFIEFVERLLKPEVILA